MRSIALKEQALTLRTQGYSLKEISTQLQIAKSTASEWLTHINLPKKALQRLESKQILGRYKALQIKRQKDFNSNNWMKTVQKKSSKLFPSLKICLSLFVHSFGGVKGIKTTRKLDLQILIPHLFKIFLYHCEEVFRLKNQNSVYLCTYTIIIKKRSKEVFGVKLQKFHQHNFTKAIIKTIQAKDFMKIIRDVLLLAIMMPELQSSFTHYIMPIPSCKGAYVNGKRAASKAAPGGPNPSAPAKLLASIKLSITLRGIELLLQ